MSKTFLGETEATEQSFSGHTNFSNVFFPQTSSFSSLSVHVGMFL